MADDAQQECDQQERRRTRQEWIFLGSMTAAIVLVRTIGDDRRQLGVVGRLDHQHDGCMNEVERGRLRAAAPSDGLSAYLCSDSPDESEHRQLAIAWLTLSLATAEPVNAMPEPSGDPSASEKT